MNGAALHVIFDIAAWCAAGAAAWWLSRLRLSPCAQGFTQVLDDFEAVMNAGAAPEDRAAAWPGHGVPGPFSNGYARRLPGMAWSDA